MYQTEKNIIKEHLEQELVLTNTRIDELESYTAITAPESSLGTILSKQTDDDRELKRCYVKKRKLLYFLERLHDIKSFLCTNCNAIIEIERLLIMPKASRCNACIQN